MIHYITEGETIDTRGGETFQDIWYEIEDNEKLEDSDFHSDDI